MELIWSLYHFAEIFIHGDFNIHHRLWLSSPFTEHPGPICVLFTLTNSNISVSGHYILKTFSVTSQRKQSRKSTEQVYISWVVGGLEWTDSQTLVVQEVQSSSSSPSLVVQVPR
ncbi:hypothetical protein E2C01_018577 [Portunus trituberculatus]|uniref:Endonuclease/exonuclease/phosphatase domain-containing protein n=1 Tax=Portunus trituberculatus TaxID=210409 RepID=A0A5B7DUT7_PORTR|nr:hypothetical protein [Portunus trituberculatus]